MSKNFSVSALFAPHKFRLCLVVLVNFISVVFSVSTFLLIDPFIHILFYRDTENVSVLGNFILNLLSNYIDIQNVSDSLLVVILSFVLLYFFKNLFLYLSQWLMASVRSQIVSSLRSDIFDRLLILPLSYFSSERKGDVISRSVNDTQEIEFTIIKSIQQLLIEPLTVILFIVTLFVINYRLSLFVLVFLPLAGLIISCISKSLRSKSRSTKSFLGLLLSHVEETLSGLKVIHGFNAERHANGIFDKFNANFTSLQKRIYRLVDLASPVSEFLGVTVVMIILVVGGFMVLQPGSHFSPELFITYIALFIQIINPAKTISTAVSNYKRGLSTLDRINDFFLADERIIEAPNAISISSFNHELIIKDVSFSYQDVPVIHDFSLKIPKGKMIAIVGPSGAGKSTLVDLLFRFYDIDKGSITIDAVPIQSLRIDDLRSMFSLVSQDVVLFNDTIENNIIFGLTHVSSSEVVKAAQLAYIDDYIQTLPDKYQTIVGDRGLNLSGGQRQRISIARAILRNAPILVLDEATSAMDSESEKLVQRALDDMFINQTSIVIAHRLSTVRHADLICVMNEGTIVEQGTHDELYQLCGFYYNMITLQQIKS